MQSMVDHVDSCLIAVGMLTRADAGLLSGSEVANGTFARFSRTMVCGALIRATALFLKHLQDQHGMMLTPLSIMKQVCSVHADTRLPAPSCRQVPAQHNMYIQ